jgi:uncharacterized SAM-binding protein YcdF (DUF218 family)
MRSFITYVFLTIMGLFVVTIKIDQFGQQIPIEKADAIIVAGCQVKSDGTPSLALQKRIDHAIKLYNEGFAQKIIFTGGSPDNRPTEAETARDYAIEQHEITKESLFIESKSSSTEENAQFSSELFPEVNNIILVSDSYHLFRATKVFSRYFNTVQPSGRIPDYNVRIPGAIRELMAIPYYYFKGRL